MRSIDSITRGRPVRRSHRRLLVALSLVVATGAVATALAVAGLDPLTALLNSWKSPENPGPLGGTYSTTLSGLKPATLNGRWSIRFTLYPNATGFASGRYGDYVLRQDGRVMERGTFMFGGNQFSNLGLTDTSGPSKCPTTRVPAQYLLKYSYSTLNLEAVLDQCAQRRIVLASGVFQK